MKLLYSLPLDDLRLIFHFLTGVELYKLFVTCKPLHHVIAQRDVVEGWYQALEQRAWTPRIVYNLVRLKGVSLNVDYPYPPDVSSMGRSHPLDFGAHLQFLHISGRGAFSPFLTVDSPNHILRPAITPSSRDTWVRLCDLMPQLISLKITDQSQLEQNSELPDSFPLSLTVLVVSSFCYSEEKLSYPSLGQMVNLTHLKLSPVEQSPELDNAVAQLSRLITLDLDDISPNCKLPESITSIRADKLTEGQLMALKQCQTLTIWIRTSLTYLPPTLTSLAVSSGDFLALVKVMPPTVTSFHAFSSYRIEMHLLAYLPENLIWFKGGFTLRPLDLPARLEELKKELGKSCISWLPPRLETLEFALHSIVKASWLRLLPSSLKEIHMTLEVAGSLHACPTALNLRRTFPSVCGSVLYKLRDVEGESALCDWTFPLGLDTLSFDASGSEISTSEAIFRRLYDLPPDRWPSDLQTLLFIFEHYPHPLEPSLVLLSSLTNFTMQKAAHDRVEVTDTLKTESFATSLQYLPRCLVSLKLAGFIIAGSREVIACLPRTLTHFECPKLKSFDDTMVSFLPPKLQRLVVRHAQKLSNDGMERMPRSLSVLNSKYNRAITKQVFNVCSPNLTVLIIPKNVNFKKNMRKEILSIIRAREMTPVIMVSKKLEFSGFDD